MEKVRVWKSCSTHNLPDDLWLEILPVLPVKSLLRFRSVCRSWKTWIDHPDFTRLHLHRFNTRHSDDPQILFVQGGHSDSEVVVKSSKTLATTFRLGFLQSDPEFLHVLRSTPARDSSVRRNWRLVSSIDGLLLLLCGSDLMLWNPAIRKTLPLPPLPAKELQGYVNFGLGFDPLIKEYKAVRFGFLLSLGVFAAVFTLGATNSWKMIECPLTYCVWQSSIHFNGVLYGISELLHEAVKLVSFDFRTHVFDSFELPEPAIDFSVDRLTSMDDGCSLALIRMRKSAGSIWVLEGLGGDTKSWSWIQRYTFGFICPGRFFARCHNDYEFLSIKNGEMLMKWKNQVVCYNLETQERKILSEKSFCMANMTKYMESLVLRS